MIGVAMLAPHVGQRVLHDVEGQAVLHEDRARHILARQVVVADSAIDNGARIDAVVRFSGGLKIVQ